MPLTRSFNALVQRHVAADPAFAKQLIASLTEASEYAGDKAGATRGHVVEAPDERAGRRRRCRRRRS